MRTASVADARPARGRGAALAIAGAALVVAAALTDVTGVPAAHGMVAGTPLVEPREIEHQGDFAHPATAFPMPARVGPFERVELIQYDEKGLDVSASYNGVVGETTRLPIVATLYVYPRRADADLDAAFDRLLADLGRYHGGARPEFRENIELAGRFPGRYAGFGYAEPWAGLTRDVPLRSYVVLYPWGSWWVKWRVTSPAPMSRERMKAIVDLTESLLPPESGPEPPTEPAEPDPEPRLAHLAHARSGRALSSAVRIRVTCCAVNSTIAASST